MNPEGNKNTDDLTNPKNTVGNSFSTALFYLSILFFIIGFNFSDRMVGNWYQQFMPSIGSQQISDIIFLDSLTGFAVASRNVNPDTSSILKTTNRGDNWQIVFTQSPRRFSSVKFINTNTGFVCGGTGGGTPYLYKTTNSGTNWFVLSTFGCAFWKDMYVLNNDTMWLVDSDGLCGGVFRTTNGGVNWQNQLNLGSQNPSKIYMFNGNLGFVSETTGQILRRTSNSGVNWTTLSTGGAFTDMYFTNSLTGWKTGVAGGPGSLRKTTDGGLNWFDQTMPSGGNIVAPLIEKISGLNKDTIWGSGAQIFTLAGIRGMINRTTDGGATWLFQVPDSTYNNNKYNHLEFYNNSNGWGYLTVNRGIHTTTGGDPIWLTPVTQISSEIPKEFKLFSNYPNPFNPVTKIKYQLMPNAKSTTVGQMSNVRLVVNDVTGREIITLVNGKQSAGTYETIFDGSNYSSGIYFYSLMVEGKLIDTRKMILLK